MSERLMKRNREHQPGLEDWDGWKSYRPGDPWPPGPNNPCHKFVRRFFPDAGPCPLVRVRFHRGAPVRAVCEHYDLNSYGDTYWSDDFSGSALGKRLVSDVNMAPEDFIGETSGGEEVVDT